MASIRLEVVLHLILHLLQGALAEAAGQVLQVRQPVLVQAALKVRVDVKNNRES